MEYRTIQWDASLAVNDKDEIWMIDFLLQTDQGDLIQPEKRKYEKKPQGFLLFDFMRAEKNGFKNWQLDYGYTEDVSKLQLEANHFKQILTFLKKIDDLHKKAAEGLLLRKLENLRIISLDNFIYTVAASSIFPLIAYEIIELHKLGREFWLCDCGDCGLWYMRKPGQYKNHCPDCGYPSRKAGYKSEENKERVYRFRDKKKAIKLYRQGYSITQIASLLNRRSPEEIKKWVENLDNTFDNNQDKNR